MNTGILSILMHQLPYQVMSPALRSSLYQLTGHTVLRAGNSFDHHVCLQHRAFYDLLHSSTSSLHNVSAKSCEDLLDQHLRTISYGNITNRLVYTCRTGTAVTLVAESISELTLIRSDLLSAMPIGAVKLSLSLRWLCGGLAQQCKYIKVQRLRTEL